MAKDPSKITPDEAAYFEMEARHEAGNIARRLKKKPAVLVALCKLLPAAAAEVLPKKEEPKPHEETPQDNEASNPFFGN
jgi:hypothetical protein